MPLDDRKYEVPVVFVKQQVGDDGKRYGEGEALDEEANQSVVGDAEETVCQCAQYHAGDDIGQERREEDLARVDLHLARPIVDIVENQLHDEIYGKCDNHAAHLIVGNEEMVKNGK